MTHDLIQGLNIGGGGGSTKEIKIRLIEFECKDQYLPYEAILGTMLHELCHNEFGPHNADFYRLLDDITLVWRLCSTSTGPCMAGKPKHYFLYSPGSTH